MTKTIYSVLALLLVAQVSSAQNRATNVARDAREATMAAGLTTISPVLTLSTSSGIIHDKEIQQQAANDAVVFLANGAQSDLLSAVMAEIRETNESVVSLNDKQLAAEIIKSALRK